MGDLIGKKVFCRYVNYKTFLATSGKPQYHLLDVPTKTIVGEFDNHSEPMFYIKGEEGYGYLIIPRQFVIELHEII